MVSVLHKPMFNTSIVEQHYSEKDGVPVKYVCTSALGDESFAGDIFYRETPHPEFGNRYFQLYIPVYVNDGQQQHIHIRSADQIENVDFYMAKYGGGWAYSAHRWDFTPVDGGYLDGGRAYGRVVGEVRTVKFRVKDGEFVEVDDG